MQIKIKIQRGEQICALPLFCGGDLEINFMNLKLEDNLRISLHTKMKLLA